MNKQRSVNKRIAFKTLFSGYALEIDNRCKGQKCWASLAENDKKFQKISLKKHGHAKYLKFVGKDSSVWTYITHFSNLCSVEPLL